MLSSIGVRGPVAPLAHTMENPIMFRSTVFFCLCLGALPALAQPFGAPGRMTPVRLDSNSSGFGYYEYIPKDYSTDKKWPLVLYFHGTGEKGDGTTGLNVLLKTGVPALFRNDTDRITTNDHHRPFLMLAPQDTAGWPSADRIWKMVEFAKTRYAVDTNRIYATGVSAGGGTTWGFVNKYGNRIAAAAPICGAGNVSNDARALRKLPVWAFHAFNDGTVPLTQTLQNVDRIAKGTDSCIRAYPSGSSKTVSKGTHTLRFDTTTLAWSHDSGFVVPRQNLALTIYESGGHDSWTRTYANETFWTWLLAQSRPQSGVSRRSNHPVESSMSRPHFPGTRWVVPAGTFDAQGRARP